MNSKLSDPIYIIGIYVRNTNDVVRFVIALNLSRLWLRKLKLVSIVKCTMNRRELSINCRKGNHIDCKECECKCHIPGTMEYMSRNIARLEKERPGLGESLPAFT
jgi:hypothetical protein